jgi:hypothetical protein
MLCHEDEVLYRDHGAPFIIRVLIRDRRFSRLSPASLSALSQLPDVAVTVRANIGPFEGESQSRSGKSPSFQYLGAVSDWRRQYLPKE